MNRTMRLDIVLPDQFLADLLTTAVEGVMTVHWLSAASIHHHDPPRRSEPLLEHLAAGSVIRVNDPHPPEGGLFDDKDFAPGFVKNPTTISLDTMYRGLQRLFEPGVLPGRNDLRGKAVNPDASDWDSVDADMILQLGFFGEVVYE